MQLVLIRKTILFVSDIDECIENTSRCSENATCTDTEGDFLCTCKAGFDGNGTVCAGKVATETVYIIVAPVMCLSLLEVFCLQREEF